MPRALPMATMVDVAQLVESRIVIPVVVGSSPIIHPTVFNQSSSKPALAGFVYSGNPNWVSRPGLNPVAYPEAVQCLL